jgi:hypothetical protein
MIHNAKIKEATGYAVSSFSLFIHNSFLHLLLNCVIFISMISLDKYELGVSNAWNATKLYINADIAPINDFKKRFDHNPHFHSLYISGLTINAFLSLILVPIIHFTAWVLKKEPPPRVKAWLASVVVPKCTLNLLLHLNTMLLISSSTKLFLYH